MFTCSLTLALLLSQILNLHSVNLLLGHPGAQPVPYRHCFCRQESDTIILFSGIAQNFSSMRHGNKEVRARRARREL
jgi:hypothetical protein